jgi:hypothetical protein
MSLPLGPYRSFSIPGEEITWAGECPWNKSYCFGTESGKVVFPVASDNGQSELTESKVSDEAINDVAFWKDLVGITTRSEVLVYRGPHSGAELSFVSGFPGGAHGIIATPRGRLLAPMGTEGLFCFDGEQASENLGWIDRPDQGVRNYYKVVYVGELHGKEILACATRTDGLARMELDATDANRVVSLSSPSVDLIDVCSLRSQEHPFAVAGLSLDRSLVLVRDILALSEENPRRLRFDGLRGTPYSLLSAFGHILLLTSAEIVIFPDLASRFLAGEALDHPVDAYHSPVQAVEAFIASERSLMVVTDDGVRVSEIHPVGLAGNGRVSPDGDVKVPDWTDTQEILRSLPTEWAAMVA